MAKFLLNPWPKHPPRDYNIAAFQPATAEVTNMWRVNSLFGHSSYPDHHPSVHTDAHETLPDRIRLIGDHVGHTFWGEAVVLCHVCHAELQPHEFHDGCCDDRDSCAWRALSERCCW